MPPVNLIRKRWIVRIATAATVASCAVGMTSAPASAAPSQLKSGDSGTSVECLQKGLNLYYSAWTTRFSPLTVDGYFGSSTTAKVNQFKGERNLSQNGIFGTEAGNSLRQASYWALEGDPYGYALAWRNNCRDQIPNTGEY